MISPLAWLRRRQLKAAVRRLEDARAVLEASGDNADYAKLVLAEDAAWGLGWRPETRAPLLTDFYPRSEESGTKYHGRRMQGAVFPDWYNPRT